MSDGPWITLGMNPDSRRVVVAGFSRNADEATAKGGDRSTNTTSPYCYHFTFQLADDSGLLIERWLKKFIRDRRERVFVIRKIGKAIEECLTRQAER